MFNLLFMLLFMATDKVQLQPVQQEIPQEVVSFDRNSMGYTDRPINQRRQVRNVYLDSVFAEDISRSISNDLDTIIPSFTYSIVGGYQWDVVDGKITIPLDGTYIIVMNVLFSNDTTVVGGRVVELLINGSFFMGKSFTPVSGNMSLVNLMDVYDGHKGDEITLSIYQNSGNSMNVTSSIKLVKIS